MFEESNQNGFYTDRIRGRVKLEMIRCDSDGTNLTLDASNSSPGVAASGTAAGVSITGLPRAEFAHFLPVMATGTTTVTGRVSTFDAAAGTATIVLSAAPSNGGELFITILLGRTG